eukprot:GEZU01021207.1.p1 GENE.GEZU01021207.1~~GEZU01021207.1.p1  ORF type:complete len:180 (+),score=48.72 GEZU01021207.1:438-977(+)
MIKRAFSVGSNQRSIATVLKPTISQIQKATIVSQSYMFNYQKRKKKVSEDVIPLLAEPILKVEPKPFEWYCQQLNEIDAKKDKGAALRLYEEMRLTGALKQANTEMFNKFINIVGSHYGDERVAVMYKDMEALGVPQNDETVRATIKTLTMLKQFYLANQIKRRIAQQKKYEALGLTRK